MICYIGKIAVDNDAFILDTMKIQMGAEGLIMRSDTAVGLDAMNALISNLGALDTARFIVMIKRDIFDYTEWQRNLWCDKSIDEIHMMATAHEKI